MRLGLIGTGKQGQRYLLEKNGGRHIVRSGSRRIPLDGLDGVIIATHPAGHKELALECIEAGLPVLIEKPLALNLADCEAILDAAERQGVACEVAHTYLWDPNWNPQGDCVARARYFAHERDYSPWLDWGPHLMALLSNAMPQAGANELRRCASLELSTSNAIEVAGFSGGWTYRSYECKVWPTLMWVMLVSFMNRCDAPWARKDYDFNRRVYRALFAEE